MEVESNHHKDKEINAVKGHQNKFWIGGYALLSFGSFVVYWLARFQVFDVFGVYKDWLQRGALASCFVFIVFVASRIAQSFVAKRSHTKGIRYNLLRLIRLISLLLVLMIVTSFLFENWYTAAVSLGLISLILGFALQTPISSLIAWIYIIIRSPYRIGDRIQIGTFKGDVIEIGYLDTTLWEFGGTYLTNDLPSGRLIRFPNSMVLNMEVYNYSWKKFPFIWNEIPFHVAYEADMPYIEKTLRQITTEELGPNMAESVRELKALVEQTPIDELEIKEYPYVSFRTNTNTWIEVIVTYLVHPKQASMIRSKIIKRVVPELLKQPDSVMFPNSNAR